MFLHKALSAPYSPRYLKQLIGRPYSNQTGLEEKNIDLNDERAQFLQGFENFRAFIPTDPQGEKRGKHQNPEVIVHIQVI